MTNRSSGTERCRLGMFLVLLCSSCSVARRVSIPAVVASPHIRGVVVSRSTGAAIPGERPIVVAVHPDGAKSRPNKKPAYLRRRRGGDLEPSFLVVSVGQLVRFGNEDDLCHSYFSTSNPNAFKTKLLRPNTTKGVRFASPGLVHVYCSLHAGKQATILVLPSPHFTIAQPTGEFKIADLTPGQYVVETWSRHQMLHRDSVEVVVGRSEFVRIAVPDVGAPGR